MGFNLAGFLDGLAGGVDQLTNVIVQSEVQKQRDERMAKYQQEQARNAQDFQLGMHQVQFEDQQTLQNQQAAAQGRQGELDRQAKLEQLRMKRAQQIADKEAEFERKKALQGIKQEDSLELQRVKGAVNPDAAKPMSLEDQLEFTRREEVVKNQAKADTARIAEFEVGAKSAVKQEESLNAFERLLDEGANTGPAESAINNVTKYFGTENSQKLGAMDSIGGELQLAKSEVLAGTLSDSDFRLLADTIPGSDKDEKTNRLIIDIAREGIRRAKINADAARQWFSENKTMEGFVPPFERGSVDPIVDPDIARQMGAGQRAPEDDPAGLFQ